MSVDSLTSASIFSLIRVIFVHAIVSFKATRYINKEMFWGLFLSASKHVGELKGILAEAQASVAPPAQPTLVRDTSCLKDDLNFVV